MSEMQVVPRQAIDSRDYIKTGKNDMFVSDLIDHGPIIEEAVAPVYEEASKFFETEVVVTIEGVQHVIKPKSRERLEVTVYNEVIAPKPKLPPVSASIDVDRAPSVNGTTSSHNHTYSSPEDRVHAKPIMDLLKGPRITRDPAIWERLGKLNAPRQTIEITLPAGHTFSSHHVRMLKNLVKSLAEDDLSGAIKKITKIHAHVDKSKVVEDHPNIVDSILKKRRPVT
jgi:hypothetical protein